MQTVYFYDSYRKYLSDFYEFQKSASKSYSFQKFSKAAGIRSPNYLKLVMDGERNLSVANIQQFARALELTYLQTQYFETMVLFEQSSIELERIYYRTKLSDMKKVIPSTSVRSLKIRDILAMPFYPAVLVLLQGLKPETAEELIAKKTDILPEQSRTVISALLKNGLLSIIDDRYELSDRYFLLRDKTATAAVHKNYLRSQLQCSQTAFEKRYEKDAKFFSYTFTASEDLWSLHLDRILEFLENLVIGTDQEKPDRVMQLNLQYFSYGR